MKFGCSKLRGAPVAVFSLVLVTLTVIFWPAVVLRGLNVPATECCVDESLARTSH